MKDPTQLGLMATLIQAAGMVMVAGLLLPMTRAVPGQFLRYWAYAWGAVAASLFLLSASAHVPAAFQSPLLVGYCLGEYLFGFLVWAGCREFATGQGFMAWHAALFLPLAPAAVVLPLLTGTFDALYPYHALLMGGLMLFAFVATFRRGLRSAAPTVGLFAMQLSLAGMAILYLQASVSGEAEHYFLPAYTFDLADVKPLIQVFFGTVLAFGMVVLAADRMREKLEGKNRQLEEAAAELATAARTDALTGLLNRRAFDDLARSPSAEVLSGSLAVLDFNDLKVLNDRLGHAAGDAALQLVARALRVLFRVTDPLFRTGGDEFVVVMPGCDEADLQTRLGRLDQVLAGQRLPGLTDPVDLRVAWGVVGFAAAGEMSTAFQQADDRMYACKRARKQIESGRVTLPELTRG